jgi:hypothetical protein
MNVSNLGCMSHHTRELRGGHSRLGITASLVALTAAASLAALAGGPPALAAPTHPASPSLAHASTSNGSPQGSQSGVTGGALFGGNYPVIHLESKLGRKLAIVRLYYHLGSSFPGRWRPVLAGGRTSIVSLDSFGPSYAQIAAGDEDAAISKFLQQVNQSAIKYHLPAIYFDFEHEPDGHSARPLGTPAQFVQAWDHVHQLAVSQHLDWNDGGRLHWVLILIHNTWSSWRGPSFWPGLGEVDILGSDGYNSAGCRAGKSPAGTSFKETTPDILFNPVLKFAAAHGGLPVFIPEFGGDTIPPSAQPQFISEMQAYVTAHPAIKAAEYWDSGGGGCTYKITQQSSISALAAMGKAPALQGHTTG